MDKELQIVIAIALVIGVIVICFYVKRKAKQAYLKMAGLASSASSVLKLIQDNEQVIATTPKTLNIAESLYLDKIKADFPELNLTLAKTYVTEIVTDYLHYLKSGDNSEFKKDCTENFLSQASSFVDNKTREDIKFHKTVISKYERHEDEATITFQTSCQYVMDKKMLQTRFELTYIYFLEETPENKTISLKCPNCGAPIEYVGQKVCKFCDCRLVDTIKHTWKFNTLREF